MTPVHPLALVTSRFAFVTAVASLQALGIVGMALPDGRRQADQPVAPGVGVRLLSASRAQAAVIR